MLLFALAGPGDAVVTATPDEEPPRRGSREDTRPRGQSLDMGPAATAAAIAALIAALWVRARRRSRL